VLSLIHLRVDDLDDACSRRSCDGWMNSGVACGAELVLGRVEASRLPPRASYLLVGNFWGSRHDESRRRPVENRWWSDAPPDFLVAGDEVEPPCRDALVMVRTPVVLPESPESRGRLNASRRMSRRHSGA